MQYLAVCFVGLAPLSRNVCDFYYISCFSFLTLDFLKSFMHAAMLNVILINEPSL